MSRFEHYPNVIATQLNKSNEFPQVPTSGEWHISYGKDHTAMGYFIDFTPLDDTAKKLCPVTYDGREDEDDQILPEDEWEYDIISLDQLFTQPKMTTQDWVDILMSFGINQLT